MELNTLFFFIFPLSLFAQTGVLSGKVSNAANGILVFPAKVSIVELQQLKAVDLDGRFTFEALAPGIYTVKFTEIIYVLHCFQKKSKRGIETPKPDMDMINERLKAAEAHAKGK